MICNRLLFLPLIGLALLSSCREEPISSEGAAPSLPVATLTIDGKRLNAEIASTPEQMAQGLMFRKHLPEDAGMLFVFPQPQRASFWMKNTRIPLSIAYLNEEMQILEIYNMEPYDERSTISKSTRVAYALEVNQGWFERHGIGPGASVIME